MPKQSSERALAARSRSLHRFVDKQAAQRRAEKLVTEWRDQVAEIARVLSARGDLIAQIIQREPETRRELRELVRDLSSLCEVIENEAEGEDASVRE